MEQEEEFQEVEEKEEQKIQTVFDQEQQLGEEEEFEISNCGGNEEDNEFDHIVGQLQEIVLERQFEQLQNKFFDENCETFEDTEENKMEYMLIFKQYQQTIESQIQKELDIRIPNFSMEKFQQLLCSRENQIDEQLLEMLISFSDFLIFKEIMLSHKQKKLEILERTLQIKKNVKTKAAKQSGNIFKDNQKQQFGNSQQQIEKLKQGKNKMNEAKEMKAQKEKEEVSKNASQILELNQLLCVTPLVTKKAHQK